MYTYSFDFFFHFGWNDGDIRKNESRNIFEMFEEYCTQKFIVKKMSQQWRNRNHRHIQFTFYSFFAEVIIAINLTAWNTWIFCGTTNQSAYNLFFFFFIAMRMTQKNATSVKLNFVWSFLIFRKEKKMGRKSHLFLN